MRYGTGRCRHLATGSCQFASVDDAASPDLGLMQHECIPVAGAGTQTAERHKGGKGSKGMSQGNGMKGQRPYPKGRNGKGKGKEPTSRSRHSARCFSLLKPSLPATSFPVTGSLPMLPGTICVFKKRTSLPADHAIPDAPGRWMRYNETRCSNRASIHWRTVAFDGWKCGNYLQSGR